MKEETLKSLRERREKLLQKRENEEYDFDFGLGYAYLVDGQVYPVCAVFELGGKKQVSDKLNYLLSGDKL